MRQMLVLALLVACSWSQIKAGCWQTEEARPAEREVAAEPQETE